MISLSCYSKAECYYSAYELKVEIEGNDKLINYYARMGACNFDLDSLKSQDYLLTVLSESTLQNSISLYADRLTYAYCTGSETSCLENQKDTIFKLFSKITLSKSEIKSIRVVECKRVSAMMHISNELEISDAEWLNNKTIEAIRFGFDLCDNQIFIHERNEEVNKILANIKKLKLKLNELKEPGLLSDEERKYYNQMQSLVRRIGAQEKVIVVTECTD